jgi:EAL domain-containing protein (putative c-di-GMP-specific phosphodiesterase class I)
METCWEASNLPDIGAQNSIQEETMPTALSRQLSTSRNLKHVEAVPCVCIADRNMQTRRVLHQIFDEFGSTACECEKASQLKSVIGANDPAVVFVGFSNGAIEAIAMLESMAAIHFKGKVVLFGRSENLRMKNIQRIGEKLGLAMLPILWTPIDNKSLLNYVADLLPDRMPDISIDAAEALNAGWVELWYQTKFNIQTRHITGFEALARVRHPNWGILSPASFLPAKSDPYRRVFSDFVITRAVEDWNNVFRDYDGLDIAINLPMDYFDGPQSVALLNRSLPDSPGFAGLIVEINAPDLMRDLNAAKSIARRLKRCRIATSMDDVALEWPVLLTLSDFPFAEIKVDRKLIAGCDHDRLKRSACREIMNVAHNFKVRTVAKGVERKSEFFAVRELGFDLVQGFLFGKPMSAPECSKMLQSPTLVSRH